MFKLILFPFLVLTTLSFADFSAFVDATYSVPVPFELAPYAAFKVSSAHVSTTKDLIQLTYYLPREIVNKDLSLKPITLKGRIKKFPEHFFASEAAGNRAQCFIREDGLTCLVTYEFVPNLPEVREYLKANYPASEFAARMKVAKAFQGEGAFDGGEAGGVIHFSGKFLE